MAKDHRKRLRDGFVKGEEGAFTDSALLELLLTFAIPQKDLKPLADQLIDKYGNIGSVLNLSFDDLCEEKGVGPYSATLFKLVDHLIHRSGTDVSKGEIAEDIQLETERAPFLKQEPSAEIELDAEHFNRQDFAIASDIPATNMIIEDKAFGSSNLVTNQAPLSELKISNETDPSGESFPGTDSVDVPNTSDIPEVPDVTIIPEIEQKEEEESEPEMHFSLLSNVTLVKNREITPGWEENSDIHEKEADSILTDPIYKMKMFNTALAEASLKFIPLAKDAADYDEFIQMLRRKLPYNAQNTRIRYSNYMLSRFFPEKKIERDIVEIADLLKEKEALKDVVFYTIFRQEPLAQHLGENVVWPSLPLGKVTRDRLEEETSHFYPKRASISKIMQAVFDCYSSLGVARLENKVNLLISEREGYPESFCYILHKEFPEPGIYSFDEITMGPMTKWLLWAPAWIEEQLYNLRSMGILSKVSNIDGIKHFTTKLGILESISKLKEILDKK